MTQQDSSFEPLKTRAEREFVFLKCEVIEEIEKKQKKEEASIIRTEIAAHAQWNDQQNLCNDAQEFTPPERLLSRPRKSPKITP